MDLVGIVECSERGMRESYPLEGLARSISDVKNFGSMGSDNVVVTFKILDVLVVDEILTRVRKGSDYNMSFRVLLNGVDIDMRMLK